MGGAIAALQPLQALSCNICSDFSKYVLNDCHFHSQCLEGCCDLEFETSATELSRDPDIEFEVVGCCGARKGD